MYIECTVFYVKIRESRKVIQYAIGYRCLGKNYGFLKNFYVFKFVNFRLRPIYIYIGTFYKIILNYANKDI